MLSWLHPASFPRFFTHYLDCSSSTCLDKSQIGVTTATQRWKHSRSPETVRLLLTKTQPRSVLLLSLQSFDRNLYFNLMCSDRNGSIYSHNLPSCNPYMTSLIFKFVKINLKPKYIQMQKSNTMITLIQLSFVIACLMTKYKTISQETWHTTEMWSHQLRQI